MGRCVFELFIADDMDGCKLQVIMPPDEHATFVKVLTEDFDKIFTALSKVDLRNAQASVASDKVATPLSVPTSAHVCLCMYA